MSNPLAQLTKTLGAFFKSKPDGHVVGIDVGTSSIKVVQLRSENDRAVLETYGAVSLGPYGDADIGDVPALSTEQIATALQDVLKESGVSTDQGIVAIPATASLIFIVSIPSRVKEKNFSTIVPTEARKYIPVPISDVSLDWWPIPKREDMLAEYDDVSGEKKAMKQRTTEVLVAAIHNETFKNFRSVIDQSKIQTSAMEIEVFSTIRSTFDNDLSTILVMDMGASKTKLAIVDAGIVRNFHIIDRGSVDLTRSLQTSFGISFAKAEEMKRGVGLSGTYEKNQVAAGDVLRSSLEFIFSEANGTILNYEKKYNETITKVVLTGGGALLQGLPEFAREKFQTDVVYGNSFEKTKAPAFLESALKATGPEFAVATGLALRAFQ